MNVQQIRKSRFQRNCLPMKFYVDFRERANGGQIYLCQYMDSSGFSHVDGCAATFKLSHNVRLNHATITSVSLWKLKLCIVCTALTSPLSPLFSAATVSATSCCTNYLKVSIFMSHAAEIMCSIWIWILKLWHCQVLNGIKVDVLMGSLSGINYMFMYGWSGRYKCLC